MNEYSMEAKEFSDKTVDKAIEAACEYFNCKEEDLEIEIITRGSTGLFGLGGRKAKITARPTNKLLEQQGSPEKPPAQQPSEEGQPKDFDKKEEKLEPEPEPEPPGQAHGEKQAQPQEQREGLKSSREKPIPKPKKEEIPPELMEEQLASACRITNEILEKSGLDGQADIVEQTAKPYINITGKDLSLIIGKEGKTLDALEYLVNLCLKKEEKNINYRVTIEAGGYRERRRKSLTTLAEKMAFKARKTGRPVSLQPMPARERRIIHIALRSFKGVKTHSSGEGSGRKVVITPARNRKRGKRNRG